MNTDFLLSVAGTAPWGYFIIRPDIFAVIGKQQCFLFDIITYFDAPVQAEESNTPPTVDRAGKNGCGIIGKIQPVARSRENYTHLRRTAKAYPPSAHFP